MAPGPKRKRPERGYSQDDQRPSPHRPEQLRMANGPSHHHQQQHSPRGGGPNRRQSRNNGRGGASSVPQSPTVSHSSATAMSPPVFAAPASRPPQPAPLTPAPPARPKPLPQPQASTPPPTRKVPESNEYLTPARVSQWSSEARDAVVHAAMDAQRKAQLLTLAVIFHEIIEAAMDNSMSPEELGSIIREIVSGPISEEVDPVSLFLDTLSSLTTNKEKQALVRNLLVATDIEVSRMRNELEVELLDTLGLVRNTFSRVAVRKATHALYRQSNYNLLREETEGYSKLMTVYFTTVNSEPPTHKVVSETYTRVNALIGAFDLDIGRVLDVTLDVFANLIVKHYKFFVKFLRLSAWWPELRGFAGVEWSEPDVATLPSWAEPACKGFYCTDDEKEQQQQVREARDRAFWKRISELGDRNGIHAYFELGARRIVSNNRQTDVAMPSDGAPLSKQQAARKWADEWMAETGTMPPSGNDVAAQLLGFKLRFYASEARDASDFLPDNLIYLAALLIKIGFISILDLYPHLYPAEENMSAHKEALLKAKKDKEQKEKGGVANALTMAGALPEEGPHGLPAVTRLREAASKSESERSTPAKPDEPAETRPSLPEPADQKYQLLKSLLCIGALPEALFILGRHPWLLEVYPDLAEYIIRIGHHSLSKVYEATKPSSAGELTVVGKGSGSRSKSRPSDFVPRRVLRWAKPDQKDAADGGCDYKFYWEDWIDNVPVCQEVDDVVKLCTTLLGLLGAECGQDVELLTKIIRIGRKSLADDPSAPNRKRWVDFSSTFIAPALSYTGQNPGVINEAWSLFKNFDTATRYSIYNHWFNSTKPSSIRSVFEKVRKDTNYILSRVSAQNTKEYGRKLAKISYASPGAVFRITTKRLINYSNMIDTMVECVRYLTLLGYDCLVWAVVTYLLSPDKGDMKDNGMVSADWLKHIATFIAKACQKNKLIDPTPFLQLTAHQMLQPAGDLFMQDVLEQMCEHMGSIKQTTPTTSETAVLYQCAGPVLRTSHFLNVFKEDRSRAETSAKRLVKCLTDNGLAPQIMIAMAQHIDAFIYREDQEDAPDKVVLHGMDKLRSNMLQFLELLRTSMKVDDFDSMIPGPIEMIGDFNVRPHLALTIARTSTAHKFGIARKQYRPTSSNTAAQSNGDVAMEDAEDSTVNGSNAVAKVKATEDESPQTKDGDVEMKESAAINPEANRDADANGALSKRVVNSEIETMVKRLKEEAPEEFGDNPCVAFVVTFFALHLGDIDGAGINRQYDASIARIKPRLPRPNTRRETDDMRRAKLETSRLQLEQAETARARSILHEDLRSEMWQWFYNIPMTGAQSDTVHMMLLQDCFLPRATQSVEDAQFAAAMLLFMHTQGVPGFRTIKVLDHLFNANKLVCLLSLFSQNEANTFGRFINGILRELERWHENKEDAYAKSAVGINKELPGFGKRFDTDRKPTDHLSHDEYCHLLYKWHKILFTAIKYCLSSGDFQQIRNSLCVLQAVKNIFPKVKSMATELSKIVDPMQNDERQDLQTQARSSMALFVGGKTISEYKFRNLEEPKPAPGEAGDNETSQTPPPQDSAPPRLNAGAPSFRPEGETNGVRDQSALASKETASQQSGTRPSATKSFAQTDSAKAHDNRGHTPSTPAQSSQSSAMPVRLDNRNTPQPAGRTSHALPNRPDSQPPRNRPSDRPVLDRQTDPAPHGRYDSRGPPSDYGRLERPIDSTGRLREASPGRRSRVLPDGRTPERMPPSGDHRDWPAHEYDDRNMRAPPRDVRGPLTRHPQAWESRDLRDARDNREYRDRPDSRGQGGPPVMEPRRMHSNSALGQDHSQYRRDMPPHLQLHHAQERGDNGLSRSSPTPTSPAAEGPTVNPARAALINDQLEQHERPVPPRPDRDGRREQRGSRPQSPHRESGLRSDDRRLNDRPPSGYHSRHESSRDLREERGIPPLQQSSGRDRRDDASTNTPTGPRGGRSEAQAPAASREMFQPPSRSQRSSVYQAQDPNYGRLNQPSESAPPSGPRSERPQQQQQPQQAPAVTAPAQQTGIHPSRLENIQRPGAAGSSPQSNMPNAPSGPRGSGRGPQVPPLSSPVNRGPPTGPAATDRGPRANDRRNQLGTINNTLNQAAPPSERSNEHAIGQLQNPPVRGRGSTRANGMTEGPGAATTPMPPPHGAAPNSRSDSLHHRNSRSDFSQVRQEFMPPDDGKQESRSHHGRRSERSGRERSRSPDRSDRRPDERSTRNGPSDRPPHIEGEDRERNGRDKRGGESSSRRERDGERSSRGEPRESSGRSHRSAREDGRTSGRDERDRRSRGGPGGSNSAIAEDGRKRGREVQDQGQGYADPKRRR